MKAAVLAGPKEAKAIDVRMAPRRVLLFLKVFNPAAKIEDLQALQPDIENLRSIGSLTLSGGKELKLRAEGRNFNLARLLKPATGK